MVEGRAAHGIEPASGCLTMRWTKPGHFTYNATNRSPFDASSKYLHSEGRMTALEMHGVLVLTELDYNPVN